MCGARSLVEDKKSSMNRNAAMNEIALILNGQRERIKVEQCIGGRPFGNRY